MFRVFADIFRPKLKVTSTPQSVDDELKKYADSLNSKRQAAIDRLGNKWVLHPDHHVKNQGVPANTLGFK
jgi:hypothetical protein